MRLKQHQLILIVGVILAVIAILFINTLLPKNTDKIDVIVAKTDIAKGTIIGLDQLALNKVPSNALVPGAIRNAEEAVGKRAGADLYMGEQILEKKLGESTWKANAYEKYLQLALTTFLAKPGDMIDVWIVMPNGQATKQLSSKRVVSVLDTDGRSVYDENGNRTTFLTDQSKVEIIVTDQELQSYFTAQAAGNVVAVKCSDESILTNSEAAPAVTAPIQNTTQVLGDDPFDLITPSGSTTTNQTKGN